MKRLGPRDIEDRIAKMNDTGAKVCVREVIGGAYKAVVFTASAPIFLGDAIDKPETIVARLKAHLAKGAKA